jgi:ATP-dependent helicase/nuclease subunit B
MDAVQFILGRSGTGKTRWCTDAICRALEAGGEEPLILLVPEQATYQAERAILSSPGIRGFSRLRILSFNRLQFWLDGRPGGEEISRTGKQMVLQKLLLETADQLKLYKGPQQRSGLAEKLAGLMTELQQANCTPQQTALLAQNLANKPGQEMTAAKWADIALLYNAYADFFQTGENGFINPDTRLRQTAQKVREKTAFKGAKMWVDGFSGFSVQERDLLVELVKVSKAAHIALCLDAKQIDLTNTDEERLDPYSLFAATEATYTNLLRIFQGCGLPCREPVILETCRRFEAAPALGFLEANLFELPADGSANGSKNIRIAACTNVRAETAWVARVIRKLVRDRQMRYRDIAVVVPDMNNYAHYIESAFAQYNIPYFLDRVRNMKHHPVTALLGAALQAAGNHYALSDVLSYLKSDLTGIDAEAVDRLENYCRAFDVQGNEWLLTKAWDFAPADEKQLYHEDRLDTLRRKAIAPLVRLEQQLTGKDITAGAFTQGVWGLLEELGVQQTLAAWSVEDVSDQLYGHRQLFARLVELLDEMGAIFGEQKMPLNHWTGIFSDALSSLTVKLIPPTLDQVLVGSIERSRHPDVKAIFLIGVTQKQFPVPLGSEGLLGEADYKLAAVNELELSDPTQLQLVHRQYLTYIALTRASKYLFISYPLLDEKGSAVVPWSGIDQLQKAFGDVRAVYPQTLADTAEEILTADPLAQWLCAAMGKDRITGSGQEAEGRSEAVAAGVWAAMRECGHASLEAVAEHVNHALEYDNAAVLEAELLTALPAGPLTTSVTRLGTFAACPYQYFAKYLLRLEKRKLLRFEPMDIGTFYHAVLEALFKRLAADGKDWADAGDEALPTLCEETAGTVIRQDAHITNYMRRNAHHRYIIDAAVQTLKDFMPTLTALSRAGVFRQTAAELAFGPGRDLELTMQTGPGRPVAFAGKIDRLDTATVDGQTVGVVFDFKRAGKSVNFAGMLYGLDLQLPVYLLAVGKMGGNGQKRCLTPLVPAGAFYLPIEGGVQAKKLSQLGQEGRTLLKAKGLFDGRFADRLDTAASGGWSRSYNFYTNKDGDPYGNYGNSGALSREDFAALLDHTVACVCRLAGELAGGKIAITPYRLGKQSPCSWCDYRALCRFDWQVNDYHILESCGKEDALAKMKEE